MNYGQYEWWYKLIDIGYDFKNGNEDFNRLMEYVRWKE